MSFVKKLDEIDQTLLLFIANGGGSCTYLASIMGERKEYVRDRVIQLIKLGYVESVDNNQKYMYRKYIITESGLQLVQSMNVFLNLMSLKLKT